MRRTGKVLSIAATCVLTATSVTVLSWAAPAAAATCQAGVPSDFNGDGIADAAIVDEHGTGVRRRTTSSGSPSPRRTSTPTGSRTWPSERRARTGTAR